MNRPTPLERLRSLDLRRTRGLLWGVGDQAVASAGNLLLTIAAARSATTEEFGAFSVVLATHYILLTSSRALVSMPLMMRHREDREDEAMAAVGSASLALMLGVLVALIFAVLGLSTDGLLSYGFLLYSVTAPMLLLQDSMRFVLNVTKGAKATAINDGVWTVVQVLVFVPGLLGIWPGSPFVYLLLWGCSAGIAAIMACINMRFVPSFRAAVRFAKDNIGVGPALLIEGLAASASAQIASYALALTAGLSVVGRLQASQVLFGPVNLLFAGVVFVAVPAAVRMARRGPIALTRACLAAGMGLSFVALAGTVAAMLVPNEWGRAIVGESWVGSSLILPTGLCVAANAFTLAAMTGWRAVGVAKQTMFLRLLVLPLPTLGALSGYAAFGTIGAAYGIAVSCAVIAAILWVRFLQHMKVAEVTFAASEASIEVGSLERD